MAWILAYSNLRGGHLFLFCCRLIVEPGPFLWIEWKKKRCLFVLGMLDLHFMLGRVNFQATLQYDDSC